MRDIAVIDTMEECTPVRQVEEKSTEMLIDTMEVSACTPVREVKEKRIAMEDIMLVDKMEVSACTPVLAVDTVEECTPEEKREEKGKVVLVTEPKIVEETVAVEAVEAAAPVTPIVKECELLIGLLSSGCLRIQRHGKKKVYKYSIWLGSEELSKAVFSSEDFEGIDCSSLIGKGLLETEDVRLLERIADLLAWKGILGRRAIAKLFLKGLKYKEVGNAKGEERVCKQLNLLDIETLSLATRLGKETELEVGYLLPRVSVDKEMTSIYGIEGEILGLCKPLKGGKRDVGVVENAGYIKEVLETTNVEVQRRLILIFEKSSDELVKYVLSGLAESLKEKLEM